MQALRLYKLVQIYKIKTIYYEIFEKNLIAVQRRFRNVISKMFLFVTPHFLLHQLADEDDGDSQRG